MADTSTSGTAENYMERLLGTWRNEVTIPRQPPILAHGQTTIKWLEEGQFLEVRGSMDNPDFPRLQAIIGYDGTTGAYSMLYFDSRAVSRIYQMSLSKETWMLWREAPEFSQRFTGKFSDDGNTITGFWEMSKDGSNWQLDFDLTYTKIEPAER